MEWKQGMRKSEEQQQAGARAQAVVTNETRSRGVGPLLRIITSAALILTTTLSSVAHAQALPSLGAVDAGAFSPAQEKRTGEAIMRELRRAGVILEDPEATDYLRAQAYRLLRAAQARGDLDPSLGLAPEDFEVFVVAEPSINAFALPGGKIGMHSGLMVQAGTEGELMSVLAHEIAHVTQRHIAQTIGRQGNTTLVMATSLLLAILAGASGSPDASVGVLALGETLALRDALAFSQGAERDADRVGLELMAEAGFPARDAVALFERLGAASQFYENRDATDYLRTHPLSSERVANARNFLMRQPDPPGLSPASQEFLMLQARLGLAHSPSGDARAVVTQRLKARARQAETDGDAAAAAAAHYGLAWAHLVEARWSAAGSALAVANASAVRISDLARRSAAQGMILRAEQELALRSGNLARAWTLGQAEALRAIAPVSLRAQERTALAAGVQGPPGVAPAEVHRYAEALLKKYPRDSETWRLAAEAADRAGLRADAHRAVAESLVIRGALASAIQQLELAQRAGSADVRTGAIVQARLNELRRTYREELERDRRAGVDRRDPIDRPNRP